MTQFVLPLDPKCTWFWRDAETSGEAGRGLGVPFHGTRGTLERRYHERPARDRFAEVKSRTLRALHRAAHCPDAICWVGMRRVHARENCRAQFDNDQT